MGAGLRPPRLLALLARTMHTSTQLPVRLALLLLASLIFLSQRFGFEAAIGAFAAGMIVGVAVRGPDGEDFRTKIDAVCFGWFAPFFFVGTGVAFDVVGLCRDLKTMLLVPVFLALFLLARGLPAWLYRRDLPRKRTWRRMALSSSVASLGIVVVVTSVGLKSGRLATRRRPGADRRRAVVAAGLSDRHPGAAGAGARRHPARCRACRL
jgi:Kef-type K+ transport system membrane component KefB